MATAQHANDPIRIGFEDLNGVAVDSSTHDVYVSSYKDGIRKMAPDGTITTLPDTNRAERVAVDSSTHDVYYRAGSWVNKVEPNGSKRVIVVGGLGAFAVDPVTHNLYVAFELRKSVTDHGIMKFAPNYITNYGIMKFAPNGATIGCVTGSDTGRPSVSPSTSTSTTWWSCLHSGLSNPLGVAVDPTGISGWIYISDTGHNEIKKVDHRGIVTIIGGRSDFHEPFGLAMDRGHDAFVADYGHNDVKEIFGRCHCITARWHFVRPRAVAVDSSASGAGTVIYVVDADGLWKITP